MRVIFATAISLCIAVVGNAKERPQYPLTLKVLRTDAIAYRTDGSKFTTTCTVIGSDTATCTSRQAPGVVNTILAQIGELSDGNTYQLICALGTGRSFFSGAGQAMSNSTGNSSVTGCMVPVGTYSARWDKGRLKVFHQEGDKGKETAFGVVSSAPTTPENHSPIPQVSGGEKTSLRLSSKPSGAEIEMDGRLVGQTPSTIVLAPGEHSIKMLRAGFREWQRIITTSGGEVTLEADLEQKD